MSDNIGISRAIHSSGIEIAFIDKGTGKPFGIPREQYEAKGYQPPYESLPEA